MGWGGAESVCWLVLLGVALQQRGGSGRNAEGAGFRARDGVPFTAEDQSRMADVCSAPILRGCALSGAVAVILLLHSLERCSSLWTAVCGPQLLQCLCCPPPPPPPELLGWDRSWLVPKTVSHGQCDLVSRAQLGPNLQLSGLAAPSPPPSRVWQWAEGRAVDEGSGCRAWWGDRETCDKVGHLPYHTVPWYGMPPHAIPCHATPRDATPHHTKNHTPYRTIPHHAMSCQDMPCHTKPYHTVPYRTVPYRTVPYRTVPYRTVPYRTILYHATPRHTIPYHPIPYHTRSHHTTHTTRTILEERGTWVVLWVTAPGLLWYRVSGSTRRMWPTCDHQRSSAGPWGTK